MRFTTTRDIKFFHGILPAGSIVYVTTATIFRDGLGMGPLFADDCLKFLDNEKLGPDAVTSGKPPWTGPDAAVKVPEFVPAAKPVEVKPPIEVVKSPQRHAIKPAAGQGGFSFDEEPVAVAVPAVATADAPVAAKSWLADLDL